MEFLWSVVLGIWSFRLRLPLFPREKNFCGHSAAVEFPKAGSLASAADVSILMTLGPAPFLATHITDDVAWVNLIYVPRTLRRRGLGRAMFERWAGGIPDEVREIKLLAVALEDDDVPPLGFWERLGFHVVDLDPAVVEITGACMARPAHRPGAAA